MGMKTRQQPLKHGPFSTGLLLASLSNIFSDPSVNQVILRGASVFAERGGLFS